MNGTDLSYMNCLGGVIPSVEDINAVKDAIGMTTDGPIIRARNTFRQWFTDAGYGTAIDNALGANSLWHASIDKRKFGGATYDPEFARLWQAIIDAFNNAGAPGLALVFKAKQPVFTAANHPYGMVEGLVGDLKAGHKSWANFPVPGTATNTPATTTAPNGQTTTLPVPVDSNGQPLKATMDPNVKIMLGIGAGVAALALGSYAYSEYQKKKKKSA